VKGRKRHIAVDTLGLMWALAVHAAHISETRGARLILIRLYQVCPGLKKIFVDGGYFKGIIEWGLAMFGYLVEVVKRSDAAKGFQLLPKRWIVERTFGWLNWYRRLAKDYEHNPRNSEALITLAMIKIMAKRLAYP